MTWDEFKEKAKEIGYSDLDDYVKKYNDRTKYMLAFYENGEIEIDDFVVVVVDDYEKMLMIMRGLE